MKIKQTLLTIGAALVFASTAIAGDVVLSPIPQAPTIDGLVTVGYDSQYVFRGVTQGQDAISTGVDLIVPVSDSLAVGVGVWYVNPVSGGILEDELDLYASVGTSLGQFAVEVGYTSYFYPTSSADQTSEVFIKGGTEVFGVEVGGLYAYDFDLETHYFEAIAGKSFDLTDTVGLDVQVNIGFNEDSYSHTTSSLTLPVALTDSATLSPYVAGIFRDGSTHPAESSSELIGGVSLSVSF